MRQKGKVIAAFALAMAFLAVAGCGAKGKEREVKIGYFNNVTHPQALLMKAEGSLQTRLGDDTKVTWTAFNAGPAEVEALFAGDIDIGYIGPVPAISANVKSKGDVVILSGATKGGAVLVGRKGSGIKSVQDLDGKVVAIPQIGNTQHLNLLQLLLENDLKPVTDGGTVTVSAVANADVANMMDRGDIDAALVPEPWGSTLLEGGAELILDYQDIYMQGDYDVAVVVARKEFLEEYPEIADAFVAEHEAAADRIEKEKEEALPVINGELESATGKSLEDTIIRQAFERIGVSTEVNRASLQGFAELSLSQGFIDELPNEDTLYAK